MYTKQFLAFSILLLGITPATGQQAIIRGNISEESTNEPLEYAQATLFRSADSILVMQAFTGKQGWFELQIDHPGHYFLEISLPGFESRSLPAFTLVPGEQLNLGNLPLKLASQELQPVEISAEKPLYRSAIDRKIYQVEKDVLAQASSAADILRNVPAVTVNVEGNVSLRGSTNITFFINGKPSALMRANPTAALQNMPANTIERIEVISNPSAKYRPDGLGGIINIVLKKNSRQGLNGSLGANAGNQERYTANASLNYNTGTLNLHGSYGFRHASYPRMSSSRRLAYDSLGTLIQQYDYSSSAGVRPNSHILDAGLDWNLSEQTALSLSGNYYFSKGLNRSNSSTAFADAAGQPLNTFASVRTNDETEEEYELSTSLEHQFDEDHTLTLEFNYSAYDETEDQHYADTYSFPAQYDLLTHNLVQKGGPLAELSLEYARPIGENLDFEAGYVYEGLRDRINFLGERFDVQEQSWQQLPDRSNDFIFKQKIHALFATLGQEFETFSYQAGLRAEQTLVQSELVLPDSTIPNNYFRLYPTLHLNYELSDNARFQFSYSRRINRADSDEQNPFVEYSDPRNGESGNPKLKPEQTHALELGLHWQKDPLHIAPTLFYRYHYDAFGEIDRYVNDTTLITTFENLNSSQSAGLELIVSGNLLERLDINLSATVYYQQLDASRLGLSASHHAFSSDAKLAATLRLGKSTFIQLNPYFRSRRISPQGHYDALVLVNGGARQDILHKQASLTLAVSDVFNSLKRTSIIDTPVLHERAFYRRNSQILYFGFVYRFGRGEKKKTDLQFEDSI